MDYGLGPFGGGKEGGPGSLFGGGQYQSISQKILRKSLGDAAQKLLDRTNDKLSKILSQSAAAVRLKASAKGKEAGDRGSGDEMEGIEAAQKSGSIS